MIVRFDWGDGLAAIVGWALGRLHAYLLEREAAEREYRRLRDPERRKQPS